MNFEFTRAHVGAVLGRGATADVYAYGADCVLKVFHAGYDLAACDVEWHADVAAERSGLPVAHNIWHGVLPEAGDPGFDGRAVIVQERVFGKSLNELIFADPRPTPILALFRALGRIQAEINCIDAADMGFAVEQKTYLRQRIMQTQHMTDDEKRKVLALLDRLPGGTNLCHQDLHVGNVIRTESGDVVIDWCDAMPGNPMHDLARSLLLYRVDAYDDTVPPELAELALRINPQLEAAHLAAYRAAGGRTDDLDLWMVVAAAARLPFEPARNLPVMLKIVRAYTDAEI